MNPTVDELVAQAEQLSADDRDLLLVRLQQAFAPAVEPEIEAAWMAEVERRVDAMGRGETRPCRGKTPGSAWAFDAPRNRPPGARRGRGRT